MCKQALALVAHLLDCEIGDAQEVLRLVQLHGQELLPAPEGAGFVISARR